MTTSWTQNEAIELQKIFHKGYKTYWEETEAIKSHLEKRFKELGLGQFVCADCQTKL